MQQLRHVLLWKGVTAWRQYTAQRAIKGAARDRAKQHRTLKLARAAVSCLASHVALSAVKRKRLFAAALHRRSWLTQRAWRGWR